MQKIASQGSDLQDGHHYYHNYMQLPIMLPPKQNRTEFSPPNSYTCTNIQNKQKQEVMIEDAGVCCLQG